MKKASFFLALLLLASIPLLAERVDPETARKAATAFLNNNGVKTTQLTDLSETAGFTNLYIFNANEGFVVMAADNCTRPILGYSLTGIFVTEGMPENIRSWLQGYNDEIQYAIDNQLGATSESTQIWNDLIKSKPNAGKATPVVEPLIQTQWDQNYPYSNLCPPGTVTGCVATAMAQIMKYWNYPAHGKGSHTYVPQNNPSLGELFADFNSTNYDWTNMTNTYGSSNTSAENTAVATLMYHCGVSVDMKYGPPSTGGSNAPSANVANALTTFFNYSSDVHWLTRSKYSESEWIELLKSDLNQSRPIQYAGNGSGGGHAFVCDGYDSDSYFHFNWGWSGYCDAYYYVNNLNPGPGGIGSGSNGIYNDNQGVVLGIHPSPCTASTPTNLTYTQNNRSVTFSWTAANGAVNYNIYRNNNFIGNSTVTSYTETVPFGTNVYFVCSVDSNGNLSLSSNAVGITIDYLTPVVNNLTANLSGNTASFSWTAPEWCFPGTASTMLTYGDGTPGQFTGYGGNANMYWGHRFLPSDLAEASGMVIFRVSFYVREPGNYELKIYKGNTTSPYGYDIPQTLKVSKAFTTTQIGWFYIDLEEPVTIDNSQDVWVMMYDPESKEMPAEYCSFNENNGGSYVTTDITTWTLTYDGIAWLIRTYLTDGTYTYNLYQDGVKIADSLPETTYEATLNNNAANLFAVKTNFYGGETGDSNRLGFAKGAVSIGTLEMNGNDRMTLVENSVMNVTGTLTSTDPNNLIIEDGAQLIHHNDGVKATFKKNIAGYEGNSGWYTIASPFTAFDPNQIANGNYDLYAYDEDTELEWLNHKAHPANLPVAVGHGFLYAHNPNIDLSTNGTLNNGDFSEEVSLSYGNSIEAVKGFNLLGNPTAHDITFSKSSYVADGYYYLDNNEAWVFEPGNSVPAGRGFLVKANAPGQTVTLNDTEKHENQSPALIQIDVDGELAYLKPSNGVSMPLLDFNGRHSSIYLSHEGKDYILLAIENAETIELRYLPQHDGQHQLRVTLDGTHVEYLHLVDLLTGTDCDLLQNPIYNFESKNNDDNARFQLVFKQKSNP